MGKLKINSEVVEKFQMSDYVKDCYYVQILGIGIYAIFRDGNVSYNNVGRNIISLYGELKGSK